MFEKEREDSEGKDLGGVDHNYSGRNSALIGVAQKFASDSSGFSKEDSEGKDLEGIDHNYSGRNSALIGVAQKFGSRLSNDSSGKDWGLSDNADDVSLGSDLEVGCGTGARASALYYPSGVQRGEFNVDPSEDGTWTSQDERNKKHVRRQVIWAALALVLSLTAAVVAVGMTHREKIPDSLSENSAASSPTGSPHRLPTESPVAPTTAPAPPPSSLPAQPVAPTSLAELRRSTGIADAIAEISGRDVLLDSASPQSAAYRWMTSFDPMSLNGTSPAFEQRYVMAAFYFGTQAGGRNRGSSWVECGALGSLPLSTGGSAVSGGGPCNAGDGSRWLSEGSECGWYGVDCGGYDDGQNGNEAVVSIDLGKNGLSGPVVPELSRLSSLTSLTLSRNELTGTVPSILGDLWNLRQLNLSRNQLSGTLPPQLELLVNLSLLALGSNELVGTLPGSIFGPELRYLDLDSNIFHGTIPNEISTGSPNLLKVDLRNNNLSGQIPSDLGKIASLEWIKMGNNRLTGTLPPGAFGISLNSFDIEINYIRGTIPGGEIFSGSPNLEELNLGKNNFTGTIPEQLGDLVDLEVLLLYLNRLSGTVPSILGGLTDLVALDVGYNELWGPMPEKVCSLTEKGGKLEHLAADCVALAPGSSGDDGRSQLECECCTYCYPGYK